MISLPLKAGVGTSWAEHINSALYAVYGASAKEFRPETEAIDRMRDAVVGVSPTPQGRDLLYRYFAQVELLSLHIPMRPFRTEFTWKNLYDNDEVTQPSVAFEKACVLYNLAATLSHLGTVAAKDGEFKLAYHNFSCAAGILEFAGSNFLHAACLDIEPSTLAILAKLMLAQAQHCFFLKAEQSQPGNPGLLAKLATAAVSLYAEADEGLQDLYNKHRWGDPAMLGTELKDSARTLFLKAQILQSRHAETQRRYGEAVAHLREAKTACPDKRERAEISTELKALERNNDLIYHERVPATVPEIPSTQAAKPLPLESVYSTAEAAAQVVGKDLFERVIPIAVHEKASLYSEMKAQYLRTHQEKAEVADLELSSALEYMQLPRAVARLREPVDSDADVPEDVLEWSVTVGSVPTMQRPAFAEPRRRVLELLRSQQSRTDAVESVHAIKQSLVSAASSDAELESVYDESAADIAVLANTPKLADVYRDEALAAARGATGNAAEPNMSLLDLDDSEPKPAEPSLDAALDEVAALVAKLRKIQAERQTTLADLREKVHKDDATQLTVAHQDNPDIEEKVFAPELRKFDAHVRRIDATVRLQKSVLSDTAAKWKAVLASPAAQRTTAEKERAQAAVQRLTDRLRAAFDAWQVLRTGTERAQHFYADLERRALNLDTPGRAPPVPAKPPKQSLDGLSGYTTPSAYNPSMYR